MKLSQAANILSVSFQGEDVDFRSVSIDTRTLQPGALFVALSGLNFNAHNFLKQASDCGAVGALISEESITHLPHIRVKNTEEALAMLACYCRDQTDIPIVGITGSCGKTTTRTLLTSILAKSNLVLSSEKSFNNHIGVPLTLLKLKPEYRYAVLELGANHPGEIVTLTQWVRPTVAVITCIGLAHLAGFGDLAGVAAGKGEIFQGLSEEGTAVIPCDRFTSFFKKLVGSRALLTFSVDGPADCYAENIDLDCGNCSEFLLHLGSNSIPVRLPLIGKHNVSNALAASAAAHALNIPITQIKAGLEVVCPMAGRLLARKGYRGAMIIDDSYNANPSSVSAAIAVLAEYPGEKVLVLGDMLELGERSEYLHREVGEQARQSGISQLYCYGPFSQLSAQAFGKNGYHFRVQDELVRALKLHLHNRVTVLIKGSFSMRMSQVSHALISEE